MSRTEEANEIVESILEDQLPGYAVNHAYGKAACALVELHEALSKDKDLSEEEKHNALIYVGDLIEIMDRIKLNSIN